jgi:hypothetical protein
MTDKPLGRKGATHEYSYADLSRRKSAEYACGLSP